jgi:hypothetical protein
MYGDNEEIYYIIENFYLWFIASSLFEIEFLFTALYMDFDIFSF